MFNLNYKYIYRGNMNLFTRTFNKIFKSSNQQELDKIQNIIYAISSRENDIKSLSKERLKKKHLTSKKMPKVDLLILMKLYQRVLLW